MLSKIKFKYVSQDKKNFPFSSCSENYNIQEMKGKLYMVRQININSANIFLPHKISFQHTIILKKKNSTCILFGSSWMLEIRDEYQRFVSVSSRSDRHSHLASHPSRDHVAYHQPIRCSPLMHGRPADSANPLPRSRKLRPSSGRRLNHQSLGSLCHRHAVEEALGGLGRGPVRRGCGCELTPVG